MISSGYKWRCPTSILATALLVMSHPSIWSFAANCSWIIPTLSLIARMFASILFSIKLFIFSFLAPI